MKYALIFQKRDEFCDVLAQNLYYELQLVLICLEDLSELAKWLQEGKSADLIICENDKIPAAKITKYFEKSQPSLIFHIYSDEALDVTSKDIFVYPASHFQLETIIKNACTLTHLVATKNKESVPDYVPYSIQYFYNIKSFISDIYIMLKKRDQVQFVKRINAHDPIDRETLQKYQDSGLEHLYIKKEYRFHFVNLAVDEAIEELKSPTEKSLFSAADETFQLSGEMLLSTGINENTIKLTKASIVSMKQTLKNLDTIAPLLERLLKEKLSYAYKRVHLTAMFCVEILKRIDWFAKDQQPIMIEQIVFSVFLHDILLTDEKLLKIHSKLDLYEAQLSEKEKNIVLNHANLASTLVQKYPKSPAYVDVIIKQHHGTTNGVGFSENHSTSILKQAMIIIVVEKFVMKVLDYKKEQSRLSEILEDLDREFSLPSYAKVMSCLKETIYSAAQSR